LKGSPTSEYEPEAGQATDDPWQAPSGWQPETSATPAPSPTHVTQPLPWLPPQVDLSPPDDGGRRSTGPSHRSRDKSLLFSSLGRSIAGGLVAIALIVATIVAVNSFQRDEPTAPVAGPASTPKTATSAGASAAQTAPESSSTAPQVAAETGAAPEAEPEPTAPATAPTAASPTSPEAAAVRVPLTVLNSSRIGGLAASAAQDFERAGWTVRKPVGNTRYRASITTVYYLPGQEAAARQLMRDVPAVRRMLLRPLVLPGQGLTVVVTREYAG
jgi:hypothetical protein